MCLNVTTLQLLALDYVIAFYPLLLILLTLTATKFHSQGYRIVILLWYPFDKCLSTFKKEWSERSSMIDVFATFLLLSYGRIMSVSFNLLIYTSVVNSKGEIGGRYLYYDASYKFLGEEHLPYGILALLLFVCFNVSPLLLLFFYPMKCFQKLLNRLKLSHIALHTFVDSFSGSYKDGTEPGVRDCRYFAGLYLLIRVLYYIIYEATLTVYFYGISGIVTTGVLLLYAIIQPYKTKYAMHNKATMFMLASISTALFCALSISIAYNKMYKAVTFSTVLLSICLFLPQLYIVAIAIRWTGLFNFIRIRLEVLKEPSSHHNREDPSEESLLNAAHTDSNRKLYNAVSLI